MTDRPSDLPEGEPTEAPSPEGAAPDGFGDAAGEMTDATEVEAQVEGDAVAGSQTDDTAGTAEEPGQEQDEVFALRGNVASLTNDLQRLQAEYANYRRRTEEQRELEIERATGAVAKGLLPVLDDLDRAEKHGDLEEGSPFAAIAEKLRGIAEKMGLTTYGASGDVFDPQHHEAIFQAPTPGVETPTVLEVVEIGYRLGSVELRPAKVVVAVPAE